MKSDNGDGFLPIHGGYRKLYSYQKAEIIYDGTVFFTKRYLRTFDRTIDQMVQAARSGKQNIAEGSMASATSRETEIKLTNVAKASLEELLLDYEDYLRTNGMKVLDKDDVLIKKIREVCNNKDLRYEDLKVFIESKDPQVCANAMITIIQLTTFLLKRLITKMEVQFVHEGGFREKLASARNAYKKGMGDR
jgi:four helix bundle suffix protein